MKTVNLPIEMISVCAVDGQMRPLRFRLEDRQRQLVVVPVREVVVSRETDFAGTKIYVYVCQVVLENIEHLVELRYLVKTHRWILFRFL